MTYNVGIIGAARRRQGTGPFVAKTFHELGHRIAGVVGTSNASSSNAAAMLKNQYAITTQGYTTLDALLEQHAIDILAICSPPSSHLAYLHQAIAHGLHVFCEKPLWWQADNCGDFDFVKARRQFLQLLDSAGQEKCYIHVNTQWPYTLRAFHQLHPSALAKTGKVEQFAMYLCPQSRGPQMLVDSAPHGLSMLYQLLGPGDLLNIAVEKSGQPDFEKLMVHFNYVHSRGTTEVTFGLTYSRETPKPASYQINSMTVVRLVALPGYQIQLQSDNMTLDIMDPLASSIHDFIATIEAGLKSDTTTLDLGITHLKTLIDACK